jgi:hypothetical protein
MMTRASNRMALNKSSRRKNKVMWMAAAALSTSSAMMIPSAQAAFVTTVPAQSRRLAPRDLGLSSPPTANSLLLLSPQQQPGWNVHQTRLFSSNKDNDGGGGGLLSKVKGVAKSVLPTKWFQSEKEKKLAIQRKRTQDELKGGLKEMLKGAPLPIRMIGGMIAPLVSTVMSGLAESMAEQQATIESVMKDAKSYLAADPAVAQRLGEPIQVGAPFSQSSSSTSINGESSTRVDLAFPVTGPLGSGIARLSASDDKIKELQVEANGRVVSVDLLSKGRRRSTFPGSSSSSSSSADNIIEAEIIEKDTKP